MRIKVSFLSYFLGTKPFDSIPYNRNATSSADALFCLLKDHPEYCSQFRTYSLLAGDLIGVQELLLKMNEEVER